MAHGVGDRHCKENTAAADILSYTEGTSKQYNHIRVKIIDFSHSLIIKAITEFEFYHRLIV